MLSLSKTLLFLCCVQRTIFVVSAGTTQLGIKCKADSDCVTKGAICKPSPDPNGVNVCCTALLGASCDTSTYCCGGGICINGRCKAIYGTPCNNPADCKLRDGITVMYCEPNPFKQDAKECCESKGGECTHVFYSPQPTKRVNYYCCGGATCDGNGLCAAPKLTPSGQACTPLTGIDWVGGSPNPLCEGKQCGNGRAASVPKFEYACCKVPEGRDDLSCGSNEDCCISGMTCMKNNRCEYQNWKKVDTNPEQGQYVGDYNKNNAGGGKRKRSLKWL